MADEKVFQQYYLFVVFLALLAILTPSNCVKRKIEIKPHHCPSTICKDDSITIVYVTATDQEHKNIVHFIWGVYDTPSVVVAYTSKNNFNELPQDLKIDWPKLISSNPKGAFNWSTKYDFISGFEIVEVDQLHDPDDNVIFKSSDFDKVIKYDIRHSIWGQPTTDENAVTFQGSFLGGNISFTLNASSEIGRGVELPRQLYSSNGTRFSITLEKLKFNQSDTRVSLKLLSHTHKYASSQKSTIMENRSIDDEYSPGIFRTFVINSLLNESLSSFVSWKPVSYNNNKKVLKNQIPSYQYKYSDGKYSLYPNNDATDLESSSDQVSKVIQAAMEVDKTYPLMVSYGQKKDGWYEEHHYLTWSGQVGFGKPQFDSLSKTLLITIFVGLGLPVVFILIGSLYVCFKKYKERKAASTYSAIN